MNKLARHLLSPMNAIDTRERITSTCGISRRRLHPRIMRIRHGTWRRSRASSGRILQYPLRLLQLHHSVMKITTADLAVLSHRSRDMSSICRYRNHWSSHYHRDVPINAWRLACHIMYLNKRRDRGVRQRIRYRRRSRHRAASQRSWLPTGE